MANHSRVSLSLPVDLLIKLDVLREKTNLSRSRWIKEAIEAKLDTEEERGEEEPSNKNLSFKI